MKFNKIHYVKYMEEDRIDEFISNLLRIMKERGIDAAQLSEKTGIPLPSIKRILDEISYPNQAAMERISETLGLSLGDLTGGDSTAAVREEIKFTISVTTIEKDIIEAYRKLPENHWLKLAIDENLKSKSGKTD